MPDTSPTARHLILYGKVQGVFYRDWTVRTARSFGLAGWVMNCSDGTVEAHLEGQPLAVDAMVAIMREGPPAARVDRIEEREVTAECMHRFDRR